MSKSKLGHLARGFLVLLPGLMLLFSSGITAAGEVQKLPDKTIDVFLTDAGGNTREIFPPGGVAVFNVRFGLMMSDVKSYPVLVTIIVGPEGPSRETIEAYNGRLDEGFWRLTENVEVKANWKPEVPFKVIVKSRIFNRAAEGTTSFYSYYTVEGTLKVGYR